jgi:hypothetical protein
VTTTPRDLAARALTNPRVRRTLAGAMARLIRSLPPSTRHDCAATIMPGCLDAMFTGLTSDQRTALATTMTTNIDAALHRPAA